MRLDTYLKTKGLTLEQFGQIIGTTGVAVGRYCTGRRMPTPEIASRIVDATGEEVKLQDLYDAHLAARRSA